MLKKLTVLCAFAFFVLVMGTPSEGLAKPGGKSETSGCQIPFDVNFDLNLAVVPEDPLPPSVPGCSAHYCDGFEKIMAATGPGDGFRFDTNRSQQLEGAGTVRYLCMDLGRFGNGCFGVDLRFSKDPATGRRLDLCSLAEVDKWGEVGLDISFLLGGQVRTLSYVTDCWNKDGIPQAIGSRKVQVTRTKVFKVDGVDDEWEIETVGAGTACLRDGYGFAPFLENIDAPFKMTITAQEPVP